MKKNPGISFTYGKHLQDGIVLIMPIKLVKPCHFLLKSVPSQESELSCTCVLVGATILPLLLGFSPIGFWNCSDNMIFFFILSSIFRLTYYLIMQSFLCVSYDHHSKPNNDCKMKNSNKNTVPKFDFFFFKLMVSSIELVNIFQGWLAKVV